MNPRGFALVNGLVLSAIFVTTVCGQTSTTERKTLVPNWLSRGTEQEPKSAPATPAQNPFGQSEARQSATPRTAVQPRAGSARATSADGFTLPGLGGSRLPASEQGKSQNSATESNPNERYGVSQDGADYPVIREVTPSDPSVASADAAGVSPSRHSPNRRTTPHIDPNQLRRELAGSFSDGKANGGQAARTARADDQAMVSDEVAPEAANEFPLSKQETSPVSPSLTHPTLRQSPSGTNGVAADATPTNGNSPRDAAEAFGGTSGSRPSLGASDFIRSPRSNSLPELPSAARSKEAFGEALQVAGGGDPSVLVSNQTPVISTDIRGPKQILVGREAVYRVRLQNHSAAAAEGIVVNIRIPSSAEVIDTTPTQGTVQPARNDAAPAQLEWRLARLEGRGSEILDIRLVPRESRPLELGVSWTLAPVGSRAIVEVQEALLSIEIGGPNEVLFDKPQVYRLTLSNPGTGTAENVRIDLVPPGGTQETATSHPLGDLQPGDSKTVEIELNAREAGKLMIKAIASAEGGLVSDTTKEIFCRKPELELDWRGPATKYAGTPATYFFRVRNPGTAPAEDVTVQVTLPEGAEFNSASEGQVFDAERREIAWRVGTLGPGDDNYMELKCVVKSPGLNQLKITAATSAGGLTDSAVAETNVVALADLKLSVSDPSGPVAVGSQAMYEIRVENRGANTAKDVNVVALFSEGIEPDKAEGAMYTVTDGRVTFRTIEELPAGRDITLRIRARALKPGTHVFRAEVLCSELEIKLAAEETTRFYSDEVLPDADEPHEQARSQSGFEAAVR